jgi:hypothetical protein
MRPKLAPTTPSPATAEPPSETAPVADGWPVRLSAATPRPAGTGAGRREDVPQPLGSAAQTIAPGPVGVRGLLLGKTT